jgi:hypothetical protein
MISEGEITEVRAIEIARHYFHDTTAQLFGIATLPAADAP